MPKSWFIMIIIFGLLFAACQPQNSSAVIPSPYPSGDVPNGSTEPYPAPDTISEEKAMENALQKASEILNVPRDKLKIQEVEKRAWANACLELPQPDEACAEMIVSGYRIHLLVDSKTVVIHTNQDGTTVRVVGAAPMGDISEKVKIFLMESLGVNESQINILQIQEVEWPDSCLGISQPDQMCLQVITPGYRILVEVQGKKVTLHTNRDGSRILQAKR